MASGVTSPRLAEIFKRENFVLRDDLQQDKRSALRAVAAMFDDHKVPYVIVGGLAVQLYNIQARPTVDVDVVSIRREFKRLMEAAPWEQYGFELVFDRRRYIKLKHVASNVDVDINVDTRLATVLDTPTQESIEGQPINFCAVAKLALTKLRTQRSDWPRDPVKRIQDRGDLAAALQAHPEIADDLRNDPLTNDEMRTILDGLLHELANATSDELPEPEDGDDD